ncbi:MAG: glycosyltransferase [Pseudomonadota bacterium]|nr:glycosyltransferase [Pseudomonadota bacterium]
MKPPRVLMLTPSALPAITGNAMTVERWRRGLTARGGEVLVLETRAPDLPALTAAVAAFRPEVVHAHHLFLSGGLLLKPPLADLLAGVPAVATPAGTDLNQEDLSGWEKREWLGRICGRIGEMVIQNRYFDRLVAAFPPENGFRVSYVPKSFCWQGDAPCRLRERTGLGGDAFVFFLPAGIRPVKGNLAGLQALAEVRRLRPHVRAVFAGPVLDHGYGGLFAREIERMSSFARWLPAIDPREMAAAYGEVDVVLNASISEGLANVLLEAMAAGKPILAADIEGNRWPVRGDGGERPCGLLYDPRHSDDFIAKALRLTDDGDLRADLIQAARDRAAALPAPEEEIDGLLAAYDRVREGWRSRKEEGRG